MNVQEICKAVITNLEMGLKEVLKSAFAEVLPEVLELQPAGTPADIPAARTFRSSGVTMPRGRLSQRQWKAFVKLFDGDEDEANRWLEQNTAEQSTQHPAQRTAQRTAAVRRKVVLTLKRSDGRSIRASILQGVKSVMHPPKRNSGDTAKETLQNWRQK